AGWQSGHAADCKSVYAGSIPTSASTIETPAGESLRGVFICAQEAACMGRFWSALHGLAIAKLRDGSSAPVNPLESFPSQPGRARAFEPCGCASLASRGWGMSLRCWVASSGRVFVSRGDVTRIEAGLPGMGERSQMEMRKKSLIAENFRALTDSLKPA